MNKRFSLIILGLVLTAGAGWLVWDRLHHDGAEAAQLAPASGAPAQAVAVIGLQPQVIPVSQTLPGRVSAYRQSQVRPQVNGLITERLFEEGAMVEQGQQLYQIDDARYKAALASAEADLKSARSTINSIKARSSRYEELVKIDAVSRQELDDVRAQLDQAVASVAVAEAAVEVAKVNLDYTKVYAPISGTIGRSLVTEGALVTANQEQPLAVITQLDPVYVDMQQSGVDAMAVQQLRMEGQESVPVSILMGENNELSYPHEGTLKFSEVTVDETTGSVTLRAVVPNPDRILLPGLFVRAALALGEKTALLVPQRAATRTPDGTLTVWVVGADNTAQPRVVETSGAYQDSWVITGGLQQGETIIVEGYQKVGPGMSVAPSPWQQAQAQAGAAVISPPEDAPAAQPAEQE